LSKRSDNRDEKKGPDGQNVNSDPGKPIGGYKQRGKEEKKVRDKGE